jgi:KUP system potassium uptake protein
MYSDLGHCGKENIRASWIFVKVCLILNYLGQGALLLDMQGQTLEGRIPFFEMFPSWFYVPGIILTAMATIIASQALITGAFSIINEAIKLKVWYRSKIDYPTEHRQQLYIPAVNWLLFTGCLAVVLFFQESSKMEAAYGLAITIDMLCTTTLMTIYFTRIRKLSIVTVSIVAFIIFIVEIGFMYANMLKVFHGAWVTLMIMAAFYVLMFVHYRASRIRRKAITYSKLEAYKPMIEDLILDDETPKFASNIVYMINANRKDEIEYSIIDSILMKQPKRAQTYWFVNIHVTDEPYTQDYKVTNLIPHKLIRIDFFLGYRTHPSASVLFKKAVSDLHITGEYVNENPNPVFKKYNIPPDFKFITIEKVFATDASLGMLDQATITVYKFIEFLSLNAAEHYELTTENLLVEKYPVRMRDQEPRSNLKRVN